MNNKPFEQPNVKPKVNAEALKAQYPALYAAIMKLAV